MPSATSHSSGTTRSMCTHPPYLVQSSSSFDSSTVMTPFLPTFCIAPAMMFPMVESPLDETVPTCAILSLPSTVDEILFSSSMTASTWLQSHVSGPWDLPLQRRTLHP